MEIRTLDQVKADIDAQINDVTDYLCSRGDTLHLRDEVKERTRKVLYALALKGWVVSKKNQEN
ncbi:MAG: hypothetical protein JJ902_04205 [Roseibium sp.]|nr:hypothetical protein [Roseibium sp.]